MDTNVLVSALLSPHGTAARILDMILMEEHKLLIDDRIFQEYREILQRPKFGFPQDQIEDLLEFLFHAAEPVSARPLASNLPDKDDQPFAEVALSGQADALITGNERHFPKKSTSGLRVLSPSAFLASLRY